MKLIQTKDYLLWVDEKAEINNKLDYTICNSADGTKWLYQPNTFYKDITKDKDYWKVLAYYPLNSEAKELEGLPLLPSPFEEVDIESYTLTHQELRQIFDAGDAGSGGSMYNRVRKYNGYDDFRDKNPEFFKAAQSKQFSLEDMEAAVAFGITLEKLKNDPNKLSDEEEMKGFIQSLSTQQLPKEFIHEYENKCWCLKPMNGGCFECTKVLKTITNSQGQKVVQGEYKFK